MPESDPRTIAAAQARVDFYDALRGHPSEWTEIDYAEAEASLKAADAWDAANGVLRISVDGLRDQAGLSALTTNTGGKGDLL